MVPAPCDAGAIKQSTRQLPLSFLLARHARSRWIEIDSGTLVEQAT
jgi:hypothetical protein